MFAFLDDELKSGTAYLALLLFFCAALKRGSKSDQKVRKGKNACFARRHPARLSLVIAPKKSILKESGTEQRAGNNDSSVTDLCQLCSFACEAAIP